MKKNTKICIAVILIVLGIALIIGTVLYAKNHTTTTENNMGNMPTSEMQTNMPMGQTENNDATAGASTTNDSTTSTPPEKPSDENMTTSGAPGNMPTGEMQGMPTGEMQGTTNSSTKTSIGAIYVVLIGIGSLLIVGGILYLIMSGMGSHSAFLNGDKALIFILTTTILVALMTFGISYLVNNYVLTTSSSTNNNDTTTVSATGKYTVSKEETSNNQTYTSETSDENAILVTNGGNFTLTNPTITKTGDSSNVENSEFYGINAAILVQANSQATIKGGTITTNSKGSNAVFATGTDSKIYISDTKINTTSDSSRGLDATYGGYIEGSNLTITTNGSSCATIATDRGEGTVKVSNSTLETNGAGSPIIYSTGDITLTDSEGTSTKAQAVVIEGKNSATITNTKINTSALGNRNNVDNAGVMIYQSMSGDASEGTGTFTATDSEITVNETSSVYKTAPMFFITNTNAIINLKNTKLTYGSNVLLSIKGTSEWGNTGSNGGTVALNATSQTLTGNIELDSLSSLTLKLVKSTYTGAINGDNASTNVNVTIDASSIWNVTGTSHVKVLTDIDTTYANIKSNGNTIYYSKDNNTTLNGATIELSDGGKLVAE